MGGDVIGALFPVDSRSRRHDVGAQCSGDFGELGFLIASAAGYMFNAVTAFLGVLVFFQRSAFWRCLAGAMFVISLPYFLFEGATQPLSLLRSLPAIVSVSALWPDETRSS